MQSSPLRSSPSPSPQEQITRIESTINQLFPAQILKINIECKVANIISNVELQQKLNYPEWSHVIKKERTSSDIFLGLIRNRCKKAVRDKQGENNKKPKGRPKQTWLRNVQKQLIWILDQRWRRLKP